MLQAAEEMEGPQGPALCSRPQTAEGRTISCVQRGVCSTGEDFCAAAASVSPSERWAALGWSNRDELSCISSHTNSENVF